MLVFISSPELNIGFLETELVKAMATHSSTLAWKIPWMEEPGRLQFMGSRRVDATERLHFHFSFSCIGEGNGNPLQCFCLENPRGGVAQSPTRLKRLSGSSSSNGDLWGGNTNALSGVKELSKDMALILVHLPFASSICYAKTYISRPACRREKQLIHHLGMDFLPASLQIRDGIDLTGVVELAEQTDS